MTNLMAQSDLLAAEKDIGVEVRRVCVRINPRKKRGKAELGLKREAYLWRSGGGKWA